MRNKIENWKEVKDYEGLYQVSNLGNVKSLSRYVKHNFGGLKIIQEKVLKNNLLNTGYFAVGLCKKGNIKRKSIHRLVAESFIFNEFDKLHVNHINSDRTDNRVENLDWCTQSENNFHAFKFGNADKKGVKHHLCKLTEEEVLEIRSIYKKNKQQELHKKYNVGRRTINNIILRKSWKHI